MIIQFFKGPKDGEILKVPDKIKEYVCETIPQDTEPINLDPEIEAKTKRVYYYIECDSRPDGVYWAIFEGVEIS